MRAAAAVLLLAILGSLLPALPAAADWPYLTEEAANLGEGEFAVAAGVGYRDRQRETRFYGGQLLSEPEGVYWHAPELQATLGVGSRAEVSADYSYRFHRSEGGGENTAETGDLRLWTKLGLIRARSQDFSVRFGVKLPNAGTLGTDEADVFLDALYDITWGQLRASLNGGLAVLGNPAKDQAQDDMLTWAAALRWGGVTGATCGFEAAGQSGPYGLDRKTSSRTYGLLAGWGWGAWRVDGALRYGVHEAEGWGWLAGVTYSR